MPTMTSSRNFCYFNFWSLALDTLISVCCCIVLKCFAQALSHFCCVCILMLIMPPNALTPPSMCKKRNMCSNSSLPPCAPHVHNCATTNRCNLCPPAFLSSQKKSGICRNIWQLHGAAPDFSTSVILMHYFKKHKQNRVKEWVDDDGKLM